MISKSKLNSNSNSKTNSNILYLLYISIIIILAILIYRILYKYNFTLNNYDSFESPKSPKTTKPSFERTQLYGSLFLDNLNQVITNMTDPPILYDTKQIELIRYSDAVL